MPQKKHIFIDLDLLVTPHKNEDDNTFEFNSTVIDHLEKLKSENRKAQFHILFNDDHVLRTPKAPYQNIPLCLFPASPNHLISSSTELLARLKSTYPKLFRTKNKRKTPDYFYVENFADHKKLDDTSVLVSNDLFLAQFIETPLHQVPIKILPPTKIPSPVKAAPPPVLATPIPTAPQPFSPNRKELHIAKAKMLGAQSIHLIFDFDDTIIIFHQCSAKRIVMNKLLIKDIIDLLNSMDHINNVVFSVLSARPDDRPESSIKIADVLPLFIAEINEGIKQKHPQGIFFKNIYCLQEGQKLTPAEEQKLTHLYKFPPKNAIEKETLIALEKKEHLGKMIVLAAKKDNPSVIVARKFTSANDKAASFVDMLPPNDNDLSTYRFTTMRLCWNSQRNKSFFLKNYFLPEMMKLDPNFIATMFDDNQIQVEAIRALQDQHIAMVSITLPSVVTLPKTPVAPTPLSQNRYGITNQFNSALPLDKDLEAVGTTKTMVR